MAARIESLGQQVLGHYKFFPESGIITGRNDLISLIYHEKPPRKELFRITEKTRGRKTIAPLIANHQPLVIVFDNLGDTQTEIGQDGKLKHIKDIKSIMPVPKHWIIFRFDDGPNRGAE